MTFPEINEWNEQNKKILPNSKGVISGHYPNYQLSLYWGKQTSVECKNNKIGNSGCLRIQI